MPLKEGMYYISQTRTRGPMLTVPSFTFKPKTAHDLQNQMFCIQHLTAHTYHIYGSKRHRILNFTLGDSRPTLKPLDTGEDDIHSNWIIVEDKDVPLAGGSFHSCSIVNSALGWSWLTDVWLIYLGEEDDYYFEDAT